MPRHHSNTIFFKALPALPLRSQTSEEVPYLESSTPPSDIELFAKYFYIRTFNPTNASISTSSEKIYAHDENGLRSIFVDEHGKMKSFRELDNYIYRVLGLSNFLYDDYYLQQYLIDMADILNRKLSAKNNNKIGTVRSDFYNFKFRENIHEIYTQGIQDLFCSGLHEGLELNIPKSNIDDDSISFLYDTLFYHKELSNYYDSCHNKIKAKYADLVANENKSAVIDKLITLSYTVIFSLLYQKDTRFFSHWKYYYSSLEKQSFGLKQSKRDAIYNTLKCFAYKFTLELENLGLKKFKLNCNQSNLNALPYIILLEYLMTAIECINKGKQLSLDNSQEPENKIGDLKNPNEPVNYRHKIPNYFMKYEQGGVIHINNLNHHHRVFLHNSNFPLPCLEPHLFIDTFRFLDMSKGIYKDPKGIRYRVDRKLQSYIYNFIIKIWFYYSGIEEKNTLNNTNIGGFIYSFNYYCFSITHSKKNDNVPDFKDAFDIQNNQTITTAVLPRDFLDKRLKRKNSKIWDDFFISYFRYTYRYMEQITKMDGTLDSQDKIDLDSNLKKILGYDYDLSAFSEERYVKAKSDHFRSMLEQTRASPTFGNSTPL